MSKLGTITVRGKPISVYRPPHNEPDFPWVATEELARALLPRREARRIVAMTHKFGGDRDAYALAKDGARVVTIMCHALAQGLCGMVDHFEGHRGEAEDGPAHREHCVALGKFAADHWPMELADLAHAFRNPGGKFLRDLDVLSGGGA